MNAFSFSIIFSTCSMLFCNPAISMEANDLLNELSWVLKLRLLNQNESTTASPTSSSTSTTTSKILRTVHSLRPSRRVGMEYLIKPERRDDGVIKTEDAEENDMRMKLFRLMYETVRDSDLKVKRAELIREHYVNSTAFEIGYLLGDVTDKYNMINDISMTLKRLYQEWKPIEHINAYEQIANQAIEINHLIDLIRIVNKREH